MACGVLLALGRPEGDPRAPEVLSALVEEAGLDARDRGLATELAYGVLRWQRELDRILTPHLKRPMNALEPAARVWLRLGAYQIVALDRIPPEVAVSATQDAAKKAGFQRLTGLVNAVLRRVVAAGKAPLDPLASLPEWIAAHLVEAYGDDAAREAAALRERPLTTLRPTLGRGGVDAARVSLVAEGLEVKDAQEGYLTLAGDPTRTAAWRDGLVVAQDPAGALVIEGVGPGQRVLDLCAGRGVKATAMADRGADVVAVDIGPAKLAELTALARHLGVSQRIVQTVARDGRAPLDDLGLFDEVLVDAPCSGLGTLRRHPEIAWRRRPGDVTALADLQARLLANAAPRVRPGGRLTYTVCSFVRVEGRPPLDCAGFELLERRDVLPSSGMDGFQIVRFRRVP